MALSLGIGISPVMGRGGGGGGPSLPPDLSDFDIIIDPRQDAYKGGALADLLSCARSAPALTYQRTVDGHLTGFAANVLRVTDWGILNEKTATNRGLYSQDMGNAAWSLINVNGTKLTDVLTAPDGTLTMDAIRPSTDTSAHGVATTSTIAMTAVPQCISTYVDASEIPLFGIRGSSISGAYAVFDCRGDGEVKAVSSATGIIEHCYDDVYRCTMVYTPPNTNGETFQLFAIDTGYASGSPHSYTWVSDGVKKQGRWGFQVEAASTPSSYIPTTSASVARSADLITLTGDADAAMEGAEVTLFVITRPTQRVPSGGDRIIGTNGAVPLNTGSDTQAQSYNGSGAATATMPYSAKFSTHEVWSAAAWTGAETRIAANGSDAVTDAHGMSPAITTTYLMSSNGSNALNGTVACLAIKAAALTTGELKTLTAGGSTFNPLAVQAWGDSLTGGNQAGDGNTWPKSFAALASIQTDNNGVGGETSTQIKNRFIAFPAGYDSPNVFWMGRNNFSDPTTVKADIATCVDACTTTHYLIGSILPSATDNGTNITDIATLNDDLATLYGTRFVDLLTPLQAANDGSANDLTDVSNGIIPRSLRVDQLHLNGAGYAVVADAYYAQRALLGL